ncbi:ThiF family adenylyltransferase [Opitutus sp. GAS368]|jgi:molybdopterin/thiamine biosynthesis adenylyltransferase/molybdopterin synthase catalytic subunit/rhodanese-related sulfurtransferase|uniref:ThiF family adenylyltransferase n=1 Tax=Opitutus sp. GAS368 TaxID=1882749 RepID=UPI00087D2E64|nr:ThiF family adenylyltransferase [Opitutus sp. GAS368]SDS19659.1 adenylyltransferase and sulfurtransferase [Opitutus sp. GAS368]
MFELTAVSLDPAALLARLGRPDAGANVVFEGRVRNHHRGRPVTHLEYEAFDDLALAEGAAVVAEAEQLHPGAHVLCVHRTGSLAVGELAVWIGVAAAHRQTAFAACRHVIEELKRRLPVWKKEHHPDGAAEWVNCTAEAAARPAAGDYHARQAALPEVGAEGQAKLAAARVLVVGLGGLGCPAALYLAGAGVGRLTLVDGGTVELSNLHRQILFTAAELGAPKALAAAVRLRLHNPAIEVTAHGAEFTARNARALVAGHDVVLDATDNFATRFLVHDACHALGVPLVSAAVHRFEGTLDVFRRGDGGCLHCQWPDRGAADLDTAGNCAGGPVFAPAVGVLGVMQAAEALKLLLGHEGEAPHQTRLVNLLDGSLLAIGRAARPGCPVCGRLEQLRADAAPADAPDSPVFIDADGLARLGARAQSVYLLEPGEPGPTDGTALAVPANDLARLRELAAGGQPVVLACRHGLRSAALARLLRAEGLPAVYARTGAGTPAPARST